MNNTDVSHQNILYGLIKITTHNTLADYSYYNRNDSE